ncbi:MAG TPA: trypsin-like peptidase domain-containing protein [Thermoanaerobaculia bacterium]
MALLCLVAVIVALGWALPAAAAGRSFAEAPMQVMTKGLTAEQHLLRQVELGRRLVRELPAEALEKAIRVPLTPEEIAAVDQAPRWVSPLKIGFVKALTPAIVVAGLDRESLQRQPFESGLTRQNGLVWAAVVKAEDAGAIRLHVQDMLLPRNVELYVYTRSGEAYGPYTGLGPNGTGELWAPTVFGPEAVLQLRFTGPVSDADLHGASFKVAEAGFITRNFARELQDTFLTPTPPLEKAAPGTDAAWPCGNESCIVDATCTNVAAANPAKLAVAKIEWVSGAFIYTCTGGLISDTNPSQDNFFLTANHCISKNSNAQNANFYWRFATSSCNGTCPANNGWPYHTTGSTVSATGRKGDFTLLHLNASPPVGSVFLGWTSAPVANTNGANLYRISNPGFGPQVYSQHNVDTSAGTCSGWPRGERIYSRDITGAIDGGSSGSPIVNASSQIVGQLSGTCGLSPSEVCSSGPGEANATVDGAFAFYFSTVKPFINP